MKIKNALGVILSSGEQNQFTEKEKILKFL